MTRVTLDVASFQLLSQVPAPGARLCGCPGQLQDSYEVTRETAPCPLKNLSSGMMKMNCSLTVFCGHKLLHPNSTQSNE